MPRWLRVWIFPALLALPLAAQDRPAASAGSVDPNVDRRTREWLALANGLEQKLLRLLPCDARVRTSLDEVARASDARIAALTAYWQGVAAKFRQQADGARNLLNREQSEAAAWKENTTDADQEQAGAASEQGDLAESAKKSASLGAAKQALDGISDASKQAALAARDQEARAAGLSSDLRELATAADAQQAAIDAQLRALAAEGQRWTAYYVARAARAQMECAITNAGAVPDSPPAVRRPVPVPPAQQKKDGQ